jgi:Uri superfamily endonuclease
MAPHTTAAIFKQARSHADSISSHGSHGDSDRGQRERFSPNTAAIVKQARSHADSISSLGSCDCDCHSDLRGRCSPNDITPDTIIHAQDGSISAAIRDRS